MDEERVVKNSMEKRVYYIGYYSQVDEEKRYFAPSTITKMNYILDVLDRLGYAVSLISPSQTTIKNLVFFSGKVEQIRDNVMLFLPFTFGGKGKFYKLLKYMWINTWLFFKLISLKKSDIVIVYHSLDISFVLKVIKRIKRIKIILECEEIYNDVTKHMIFNKKYELNYLKKADGYIFSSELLAQKITIKKNFIVVYGSYLSVPIINNSFNDGKKHIVYSGILDLRKGVDLALKASQYLNSDFILHILGYGTETEVSSIKSRISEINKNYRCDVRYEGLMLGSDFTDFLCMCDVGLCTQDKTSTFNNTSFPSKILSYLNSNLPVVAIKIPALEISKLSQYLTFYEDDSPEEVASKIKNCSQKKINAVNAIERLDHEVMELFEKLINSIKGD